MELIQRELEGRHTDLTAWSGSLALLTTVLEKVGNSLSNKCVQTLLLGLVAITVSSPMVSVSLLRWTSTEVSHVESLSLLGSLLTATLHGWRLTRSGGSALFIAMSLEDCHERQ